MGETLDELQRLVQGWNASADVLAERVFDGDPAATLATITTLRNCAAALAAALSHQEAGEEPTTT